MMPATAPALDPPRPSTPSIPEWAEAVMIRIGAVLAADRKSVV